LLEAKVNENILKKEKTFVSYSLANEGFTYFNVRVPPSNAGLIYLLKRDYHQKMQKSRNFVLPASLNQN